MTQRCPISASFGLAEMVFGPVIHAYAQPRDALTLLAVAFGGTHPIIADGRECRKRRRRTDSEL